MSGSIKIPHICPKCNITKANNYEELEEKFGFRNLNKTTVTNQSWCRDCRKKYS